MTKKEKLSPVEKVNPLNCANRALYDNGELFLNGVISNDAWSINDLCRMLRGYPLLVGKGAKTLVLHIDSPGGSVFTGFSIMNAIKSAQKKGVKVVGVVDGLAASMGACILQVCDERVAMKYSRLMIHEVSQWKFLSNDKCSEAEEEVKELKKVNDILLTLISERTGKSSKEVKDVMRKTDVWLSPEESLKFGLIDRVEE